MNKLKQVAKTIGSKIVTILIVILIFFIIYNIYKSIKQNYEVNQKINFLEKEIEDVKKQNYHLQNLILYYNTDSFKELELRRKLALKKQGETMVLVPENKGQKTDEEKTQSIESNEENNQSLTPNYVLWWRYIIGN